MNTYHKINGIFKRDMDKNSPNYGKFIIGQYSTPEFELLKDIKWVWTEKIDGTNIRVLWYRCPLLPEQLEFKGKTDKAQMPEHLLGKLQEIFSTTKMCEVFETGEDKPDVCLYSEGYGYKIQKGGDYMKDSHNVDCILFDIKISNTFLTRDAVEEIADKLQVNIVPIIGRGTINEAIEYVKTKPISNVSATRGKNKPMEGLVLRAEPELRDRRGHRIITKIKVRDF